MSETVILENMITRHGLRRVHAMRSGEWPEREVLRALVPENVEQEDRVWVPYSEPELGVWHLVLTWHAREIVELKKQDPTHDSPKSGPSAQDNMARKAAMWWMGGMPVSLAVDCAGTILAEMGIVPWTALIQEMPKKVKEGVKVMINLDGHGGGIPVPLRAEGWVPKGFVVVVEGGWRWR